MTKREQALMALHALLASALAAPVLRNEVLPEKIAPEGLCMLRDGDPGEPEVTLSPENYLYEHRAELDVVVAHADSAARDARFDGLLAAVGAAIVSYRTLGGLCDLVRALAPEPGLSPWRARPSRPLPFPDEPWRPHAHTSWATWSRSSSGSRPAPPASRSGSSPSSCAPA